MRNRFVSNLLLKSNPNLKPKSHHDRQKICSSISPSSSSLSFSASSRLHKSTKSNNVPGTSASVSKDEVSKFSSMASTWWNPDQNPLISMNPIRMEFIISTLEQNNKLNKNNTKDNNHIHNNQRKYQPLVGLKALDVGCGGGLLSESLARLGADVTAIDPSEAVAQAAYEHSKLDPDIHEKIKYKGGISVEDLALDYSNSNYKNEELFDVICILEVIEHATNPQSLVKSAISLLKKPSSINGEKGGVIFISTINRTVKSYVVAIVGGEYVTGKLPIGTHCWQNFKSPQEVNSLVGDYGLEEMNLSGMELKLPFYDLRWELNKQDTDINWIGAYGYN